MSEQYPKHSARGDSKRSLDGHYLSVMSPAEKMERAVSRLRQRITQQELKLRRIAELQRYYIPMHIEDPNFRKNHAVPLKSKDGPWIKHSELRALLAKHKEIEDE